MLQDLHFAWRALARRPAFTAVAVLTLALGLGANTAMFSVIRGVLLRPLAFPAPDRLVRIVGFDRSTGEVANLSPADFFDMAAESTTLQQMGAHGFIGYFTVGDERGTSERLGGVSVTAGFFPALGAPFALGRAFTAEEDRADAPAAVILSHAFWQRRYGGSPAILGQTIDINYRPAIVVGVLSAEFRHVESNPEREPEVFVPYRFDRVNPNRGGHFIRAVGRMRPAAGVDGVQAELAAIASRLEQQYPADNTNRGIVVRPLHEAIVAEARPALLLLGAAVAFVLLVACANLANLLLAQGTSRATELAVRAAMGASRARLVRQLVVEGVVLAALGATVGVALAMAGTRLLIRLGAADIPRAQDIGVDATVLMFAAALGLASGALAALMPALQMARRELHAVIADGVRGAAQPGVHRASRDLLIAGQVAVALVLLAGAGLTVRSVWRLLHVDTGFSRVRVLTFETAVPTARYAEGEQIPFYERLYQAIRSQPGVEEVGAINILPLSANYDSRGIQIEAAPAPEGQGPAVQARSVSPGYFRAMGIPLVRGRAFTGQDREGQPLVMIVSESMARRYWPGQEPIGQRVTFNSGIPGPQQQTVGGPGSREVVGVVGDVKHLGLDEGEVPMFYTPQAQQPSYHTMAVVVRTSGNAALLTAAIREDLARLDRTVPLYRVRTIDRVIRLAAAGSELRAWLFGLFGALALALAAIGVYGVVGYLVGQRTREIGIRLALGASNRQVLKAMMADALRPVAAGTAIGLIGAVFAGQAMSRLLAGVAPADAGTYIAMACLLLAAAVLATWLPASRALHVNPMDTLRD